MLFQHTAARRRLLIYPLNTDFFYRCFNTQPPEGGCDNFFYFKGAEDGVSTHSRPKAAANHLDGLNSSITVSTHSRPKAAAGFIRFSPTRLPGFNTQPPEGGCLQITYFLMMYPTFQHTAARRRLPQDLTALYDKLAGFNTQPPEGGCYSLETYIANRHQFQHTAARRRLRCTHSDLCITNLCFNTQPPEGGCCKRLRYNQINRQFQHTAARRRLQWLFQELSALFDVSTHSRPKAAAHRIFPHLKAIFGFNTQPPEGGCVTYLIALSHALEFQHTAARRRLLINSR